MNLTELITLFISIILSLILNYSVYDFPNINPYWSLIAGVIIGTAQIIGIDALLVYTYHKIEKMIL